MVVTFQGVDLALKDLVHIDGSIEKFDYIQIFFIPGYTVADLQFQCFVDMRRVGLTAPVTDQFGFATEMPFKHHFTAIRSLKDPLQGQMRFGERDRTRGCADPGKRDLHRIS